MLKKLFVCKWMVFCLSQFYLIGLLLAGNAFAEDNESRLTFTQVGVMPFFVGKINDSREKPLDCILPEMICNLDSVKNDEIVKSHF